MRIDAAERRRVSGPGMRAFVTVANMWGLSEPDRRRVLGSPAQTRLDGWIAAARNGRSLCLDIDVLLRISAVLGIHQALGVLYPIEAEATAWMRRPHNATPFDGRPPLDLATGGTFEGLLAVRRFLDAACAGSGVPPGEHDDEHSLTHDEVVFG